MTAVGMQNCSVSRAKSVTSCGNIGNMIIIKSMSNDGI